MASLLTARGRPGVGPALAAASALALLALMLATWYRPVGDLVRRLLVESGKEPPPPPQSAFEAYTAVDVLLVLLALGAAALVVAARLRPGALVKASGAVAAFGSAMTLVVLYRLIDPPADEALVILRPAAYLGLLATAGIALGAYLALREARTAPGGRGAGSGALLAPPAMPASPRGRLALAVALGALVVAYLATRLSFADRFPYFFDEGTYAFFTHKASNELDSLFVSFTIGREPLPFWLGIPFVELGFNPLRAVRLVSVLSGLGTVVVVGLLGRRLFGTAVGVVATALCVVIPFFVVHDGIGITEPLLILVMVSALYLQVELARRPSLRMGALLGLVFFAAVLTKESARPALVLLPLSLLCFDWSPVDRRARLTRWLGAVGLAAVGVLLGELVLRSSSLYDELEAARGTAFYTVRSLREALGQPGVAWDMSWPTFRPALSGYVTIPLLAATLVGAGLGLWRRRPVTLLLIGWILLPFGIAILFTTLPFPRHVLYLVPPAIVLMAYALVEGGRLLRRALPPRPAVIATAAGALLLLLPALRTDARVLNDPATARYPGKDDVQYVTGDAGGAIWPDVADAIRRRGVGRQVVVLYPKANVDILRFLLGTDSRYVFVLGKSPLAPRAQLALVDRRTPFEDKPGLELMRRLRFAPVQRFPRPRGGAVLTLYERPPEPRRRSSR